MNYMYDRLRFALLYVFVTALLLCPNLAGQPAARPSGSEVLVNPLLPVGPDPWVTYKDGYYYYTNTTASNITLWKTRDMADLAHAEKKVVWTPPTGKPYSSDIWAPEIHFLQGKWYVYFAGDAGSNKSHHIWVLENASADPLQGEWRFVGELTDSTNKWAIDASVFENRGALYYIWSGWEGDSNGTQSIYIAKLKNPWTVESPRVLLSSPLLPWEQHGDLDPMKSPDDPPHVNVNEGPEILQHGDKIFLIYSASGCWTDYYELGMLSANADANLLDPKSWRKSKEPVFKGSAAAGVYAPGHNSFFQSPDGKTDWILYHANSAPHQGCANHRSPRAQPFKWKADGTPDFGTPASTKTRFQWPSGEIAH
jgi:GH43 family beta-xylosidase